MILVLIFFSECYVCYSIYFVSINFCKNCFLLFIIIIIIIIIINRLINYLFFHKKYFNFFMFRDVPECSVFGDFSDGHFKLVTYIKAIM